MSIRIGSGGQAVLVGLALCVAAAVPPPGYAQGPRPASPPFTPSTAPPPPNPAVATLGRAAPPPVYVAAPPPVTNTTVVAPAYGPYSQRGVGGYLNGVASVTEAQGRYLNDVQTAKIGREEARRATFDTARERMKFEQEYERSRPTSAKFMAGKTAADLEWACKYADSNEIWSGKPMNTLLDSVTASGRAKYGPNLALSEADVRGLNLTDGTSQANSGLLKNGGRLFWPTALEEAEFDDAREQFAKNWAVAYQQVMKTGVVELPTLRALKADQKAMSDKVENGVDHLSLGAFLSGRKYLAELKDGVKAFEDTRTGKAIGYTLVGNVRTVAEMCEFMAAKGLKFAPAVAPGDQPCYTAVCTYLRRFEGSVVQGP